MPAHIEWDNPQHTVLVQVYEGDVTLDDYYRLTDDNYRLIAEQPHIVHTVLDRSRLKSQPNSMVSALRYANRHLPPNQGLRLIVGGTRFTKILVNMGQAVAPVLMQHVYFAESREDARRIIAEHEDEVRQRAKQGK